MLAAEAQQEFARNERTPLADSRQACFQVPSLSTGAERKCAARRQNRPASLRRMSRPARSRQRLRGAAARAGSIGDGLSIGSGNTSSRPAGGRAMANRKTESGLALWTETARVAQVILIADTAKL